MCFPHAAQLAQLYRHIGPHKPETVWLLTSREPCDLNATQWLQANRRYWAVEGMHQRLDVSTNEDLCRVRNRNGVWVLGMFRRLSVSLFAQWRSRDPRRSYATMTDFHASMGAEHGRLAFHILSASRPSFRERS